MKPIPETYRGSSSGTRRTKSMDIIVQGGVIQDIVDIPDGLIIRVFDMDTDGVDAGDLVLSPYDERQAILTYWE